MIITIIKISEDVKNPPKKRPIDENGDVTAIASSLCTRSWTPSTVILAFSVDVSSVLIRSVAVRDPSSEE